MDATAAQMLSEMSRDELLAMAPAPAEAVAHGAGSDVDGDLEVLWAVAQLLKPRLSIELGTRQGASTRTLAQALEPYGPLITVDPDPACKAYLHDILNVSFLALTGEALFEHKVFSKAYESVDLLFVDTDPHTYDQTARWLRTWITRIAVGGVAAFHDIVPARPEIQVADAVREWLPTQPEGRWAWREYPSPKTGYGIGLLWRLQ